MGIVQRLVGVLILLTVLALSWAHRPDRPVETLVARWAPAPSEFVELRGQLVHLRDEGPRHTGAGSPPPIVLLHGTASSLHTWEGWARALRSARRVLSVDLPGFGLTGPFAGEYEPDNYHGDAYARFVIDLLQARGIERAVIAGNSLGGEVAWRTAHAAPARVAALVLVDSLGPVFVPEVVPPVFLAARTPLLNKLVEWALPRELVAQSLQSVYGDPTRITPELVDRHYELALRDGNRRALVERLRQQRLGEHAERLATLRLPTLILWGGRDRLVPPSVGRQLADTIPGSRLVLFPELGHLPQEEDPAATLVPLREFLASLEVSAAPD